MIINLQLNKSELITIKRLLFDEIAEQQYDNEIDAKWLAKSQHPTEKVVDNFARRKLKVQKLIALAERLDKVLAE